ncbi:MAG TPA: class I SAM-dependent methyltransferase [Polyangiaceae bacterium]|nr:class I SAM-dependent methyltransferase [Polyangiaceae bacterium]
MARMSLSRAADLVLAPFVYPSAWLLRSIRERGVQNFPHCREALRRVGVFPIRDHYTEPDVTLTGAPRKERKLAGIAFDVPGQLEFLQQLSFSGELATLPREQPDGLGYYLHNPAFGPGDAEVWYQLLRFKKPRRVFEIGSGQSTLLAAKALAENRRQDPSYSCRHLCIEPYEAAWLERLGVEVLRQKVEDVGLALFEELDAGDVLFIDSSHVIRPGGDVLFEYLELLPRLRSGVIVHVHDIFSPRDYPEQWLVDWVRLWNEQYVLEAFLSENRQWKVLAALNQLKHSHYDVLRKVAPFVEPATEPASFYLQRL